MHTTTVLSSESFSLSLFYFIKSTHKHIYICKKERAKKYSYKILNKIMNSRQKHKYIHIIQNKDGKGTKQKGKKNKTKHNKK